MPSRRIRVVPLPQLVTGLVEGKGSRRAQHVNEEGSRWTLPLALKWHETREQSYFGGASRALDLALPGSSWLRLVQTGAPFRINLRYVLRVCNRVSSLNAVSMRAKQRKPSELHAFLDGEFIRPSSQIHECFVAVTDVQQGLASRT
mgnify:CR=1 FL=1